MQSLFDANFRSVWLGYQYAARQMIKQGKGGRIIGLNYILLVVPRLIKSIQVQRRLRGRKECPQPVCCYF
jgi:hypothetical protein